MVKYAFICCPGHSGSTLLDLLLGSHTRTASLGEISHFSKNLALNTECTCGELVRSCPVWRAVVDRLEKILDINIKRNPYSLNVGMPKAADVVDRSHQTFNYLMKRRILQELVHHELVRGFKFPSTFTRPFYESLDVSILLYDIVRDELGVEMVVDSSKSYAKSAGIYHIQPRNTRIILLTRDGRGVAYSYLKRRFPTRSVLYDWKQYYTRALSVLKKNVAEQDLLHVRYEDLAAEPKNTLSVVCEFLGLTFESSMLDYSAHVHHITNGNNMRFKKSSKISLDSSWHELLPDYYLRKFDRISGDMNRNFGYE